MTRVALKYCPFCREQFDDVDRCPDHELFLVSFSELPQQVDERDDGDDFDERVGFYSMSRGRGFLHLAWLLLLTGFFLPFVSASRGEVFVRESAFELAIDDDAHNLWIIPTVALVLIAILAVRRTPRQMRGARIAIALAGLIPGAPIGYSLYRIRYMAEVAMPDVELSLEPGVYALGAGALLTVVAALRFGGPAPSRGC